jgi:hypothetical protein
VAPTGLRPVLWRGAAAALLFSAAASAPLYVPDTVACTRLLEPERTYRANRQTFTTDAAGRPVDALARTLADRDAPRGECEGAVGDWGGRGDWQGGHLIAASFHGVSMRYNLVPMRGRQINQGLMARVENGARACLEGDGSVADYRVRLRYPDRKALAPDRIHVTMTPKISGVTRRITLTLPNDTLSEKEFDAWGERIARAFRQARCDRDGAQPAAPVSIVSR